MLDCLPLFRDNCMKLEGVKGLFFSTLQSKGAFIMQNIAEISIGNQMERLGHTGKFPEKSTTFEP